MNITLTLQGKLVSAEEMSCWSRHGIRRPSPEMGVFAGILTGAISGWLYNRYSGRQFNGIMAIYSGHCFVAIIAIPFTIAFAVLMWSLAFAQAGITKMALVIHDSGAFGALIYGFLERILIPTGLHHLVYTPFLYTELGGVADVCGTTTKVQENIYFAEMACLKLNNSAALWFGMRAVLLKCSA